jgi:hypothetical protein
MIGCECPDAFERQSTDTFEKLDYGKLKEDNSICENSYIAYQFHNLVMHGIAPIIKMVIKDCWHPGMREYICIALKKLES